jgi:hypothetical protein
MKNCIKYTLVAVLFICFSCNKDDDSPISPAIIYVEENPLNGYLGTSGYSQDQVSMINNTLIEAGFSFVPTVTGKINSVVVWIPQINNSVRVTIWDNSTQNPIRTEIVNVTNANVPAKKEIEPLFLTKDKEYSITMNTDDYYLKTKSNGTAAVYPITVNNLKVTSYRETLGSSQVFPNGTQPDYYSGNCSFNFQRTE